MPTYEYRCKKCRKHFDWFQKMTDRPLRKCIHCGGSVQRLIGAGAGIIFKGSGFYQTDYKKSSVPKKDKSAPVCPKAKTADKGSACSSCPAAGKG